VNWGPSLDFHWLWDYQTVLQERDTNPGVTMQFAKNINVSADYNGGMERYLGIDFRRNRMSLSGSVGTSRKMSFTGSFSTGDQIRFISTPFLGSGTTWDMGTTLRPVPRFQSQISLATSQFIDRRDDSEVFNIKIFRAQTTYQFTDRLLVRNISQYNTLDKTFDGNILITYRVNGGTVFFVGYDDHYREGIQVNADLFAADPWRRTNRSIFAKLQYLFRR
jgi:hypothetical protein